jgi:hypothetical protein
VLAVSVACLPVSVRSVGANATTLLDLAGVRIEVARVSGSVRALGIDEARLTSLIGELLARAGVKTGDYPATLRVSLQAVERQSALFAYCLELEVRQVVQLARTRQVQLSAPTWREGRLSVAARASVLRSVDGALIELVDAFVRDYRLVNGGSDS